MARCFQIFLQQAVERTVTKMTSAHSHLPQPSSGNAKHSAISILRTCVDDTLPDFCHCVIKAVIGQSQTFLSPTHQVTE
ncbi:hypothetical protein J1N35_005846 [Gossypium stocksii]|uniref:Uncharacterized protein n=1 Tax=Gossypium stocksii TaxID=47602 RepID=A0A9D3WFR1_9ROSI|nr:hypothetical protein J1N35_005846 [Gossypium stocksii]